MKSCFGLLFLLAGLALADSGPRVLYTKSFPGSVPAWVSITVERSGNVIFTDIPNDDSPMRFKLEESEVAEIFALADKLDHFKRPIESGLKVANLGVKTFRFENGDEKAEVKFNYSLDENARLLLNWFERIAETEARLIDLERTARFDKLGVNNSVLQLQIAWDNKRIVTPEQFLPMLERVAKNEAYMHMARERAGALIEAIKASKTKAPAQQ